MTTASTTKRTEFFRQVAALWQARQAPNRLTSIEYLRGLALRAAHLTPTQAPSDKDLDLFRLLVKARPDDMRRRLLGANVQRLRALSQSQRRALRALEVWPDLLSPLAELRYEPSHSRLLAYHMDPQRGSPLSMDLLRSFLKLVGCPSEKLESHELLAATVTPEAWLSVDERLDIKIETPKSLVFVEVKIDAAEGHLQLLRYRQALDKEQTQKDKYLVYLTLPSADGPAAALNCAHVSLEDLLVAWLPAADVDGEAAGYLSRYLKSAAMVLARTGFEGFEKWTFAEQRAALELVSRIEARVPA